MYAVITAYSILSTMPLLACTASVASTSVYFEVDIGAVIPSINHHHATLMSSNKDKQLSLPLPLFVEWLGTQSQSSICTCFCMQWLTCGNDFFYT